jgi:hypothetical protein
LASTKKVLAGPEGDTSQFKDMSAEMVRRMAKAFGTVKGHRCAQ